MTTARMHERITAELMDAGRRASDRINEYRADHSWDELRHKWVAVSLADGTVSELYDTRKDAVKHQNFENQYTYVAFQSLTGGANPRELAIIILFYRDAYAAGFRGSDPEELHGGRDLAMTARAIDTYRNEFAMPGRLEIAKWMREHS